MIYFHFDIAKTKKSDLSIAQHQKILLQYCLTPKNLFKYCSYQEIYEIA
jgi:hypothetical protein